MTTIALLITSVIVAGCGYIVTESNADILLAGYNTMSKKEKVKFDLKGYLNFFKKFMLSVGLYSFIIYLLIHFFFSVEVAVIGYAISISIPWPFFLYQSNNRFIK